MRPPLTVVPYLPMLPQRGVNAPARPLLFPQGPRGFGGFAGTTGTAASGAASGAAAGASIGSVVPGVGTAIGAAAGAIVGAISGLLGGKSNPQIQIDKTNAINLFSQYQAIAGTVSGRSIGYENMDMIFRGACFMGHFPDWNNETELPDSLMSMPGSPYGQNDNCFAVLWASAARGTVAPGSSGKYTGNNGAPVTNAKVFVDNYVWPANSPNVDTDPWATNTDSVGKQIIYDAADAYIATQSSSTTPYIANPPVPTPTPAPSPTPSCTVIIPRCTGVQRCVGIPGQAATSTPAATPATVPPAPPSPPTTLESADGSEVTAPGIALETSSGQILYFGPNSGGGNYPIWAQSASGAITQIGAAVGMIIGNGGLTYAVTGAGAWYQWNNGGWVQLAAAPNLNGPTTTASTTQASPQSGVACTVGNTPVTSGAVVTTTAAGDAVTDDDIQDLISQMQAQGASAQATYTAVLQALQDQGSTVSAGVQSQVASQVSASVPTTAPTTTSSDLGLYIVAGGLAVLGLLYFMGHRKA
jgi:hypothetical protein